MNLLLKPELATRELKMKLEAQEVALENALIRIGYDALIESATRLSAALVNSSHRMRTSTAGQSVQAADVHAKTVFGALSKFPFPVHNLVAAAKRASAYDISRAKKTVMILPHG